MPQNIQMIGKLSPLSWGLDAINNIYLRDLGFSGIWKSLLKLNVLGFGLLGLSIYLDRKRIA